MLLPRHKAAMAALLPEKQLSSKKAHTSAALVFRMNLVDNRISRCHCQTGGWRVSVFFRRKS
jgi:hypothetical protein